MMYFVSRDSFRLHVIRKQFLSLSDLVIMVWNFVVIKQLSGSYKGVVRQSSGSFQAVN